ncbi:hypothetical protein K439DRAFT_1663375 [Ramaria rubella]|nr:hypothetical protein K439DRAFT_1663375 [Ramaria rubella]
MSPGQTFWTTETSEYDVMRQEEGRNRENEFPPSQPRSYYSSEYSRHERTTVSRHSSYELHQPQATQFGIPFLPSSQVFSPPSSNNAYGPQSNASSSQSNDLRGITPLNIHLNLDNGISPNWAQVRESTYDQRQVQHQRQLEPYQMYSSPSVNYQNLASGRNRRQEGEQSNHSNYGSSHTNSRLPVSPPYASEDSSRLNLSPSPTVSVMDANALLQVRHCIHHIPVSPQDRERYIVEPDQHDRDMGWRFGIMKCIYPGCGSPAVELSRANTHLASHLNSKKAHQCACGIRFGRLSEANRHMDDQNPCERCGQPRRKRKGTRICTRCYNAEMDTLRALADD